MDIIKHLNRLQLNWDFILHQQVNHIIINYNPVVSNFKPILLFYKKTRFSEFMR
jgi:hypothetical protein